MSVGFWVCCAVSVLQDSSEEVLEDQTVMSAKSTSPKLRLGLEDMRPTSRYGSGQSNLILNEH